MKIKCTHCGADVPIEETTAFVKCLHCGVALVAQVQQGIAHLIMNGTIEPGQLEPYVQKQMLQREISGDAEMISSRLFYYPFWRFAPSAGKAKLVAASTPPVESMRIMASPEGDLNAYPEDTPSCFHVEEATVLLDEARATAEFSGVSLPATEKSVALVHLPFFQMTYRMGDKEYQVWIDGCSGESLSDVWPASTQRSKSTALALVAIVAFILFALQAAFLPLLWLVLVFPLSGVLIFFAVRTLLQRMNW